MDEEMEKEMVDDNREMEELDEQEEEEKEEEMGEVGRGRRIQRTSWRMRRRWMMR